MNQQQPIPNLSQKSHISPAVAEMLEKEAKLVNSTRIAFLVITIAILIISAIQSEINFLLFLDPERLERIAKYIPQYFPPDFTYWKVYLVDTLITIGMGIWGTLLAAIAAIPLSILASNNVFPAWVVQPTRRILDAMRAINELVFALIFISLVLSPSL